MKLIDLQEAKYAARRITVRILSDILWVLDNLLYDHHTLYDEFNIDLEASFEQFEDYVIGFEHDTFNLIKIQDGYAHDRYPDPNPPKPDYVILEESFDQALEKDWLEIENETH